MSEFTPLVGPLGLWNFPIVNAILMRLSQGGSFLRARTASNMERWIWVDYRGNERTIEVERKVHS